MTSDPEIIEPGQPGGEDAVPLDGTEEAQSQARAKQNEKAKRKDSERSEQQKADDEDQKKREQSRRRINKADRKSGYDADDPENAAEREQIKSDMRGLLTPKPRMSWQEARDFEPNALQREQVKYLAYAGIPQDRIADMMSMSVELLVKHFRPELDFGTDVMTAEIAALLAHRARHGSDTGAIFLLKTRGRGVFSETKPTRDADGDETKPMSVQDKREIIADIMKLMSGTR